MTDAVASGARRCDRAGFLLTETLATFTISAFVLLGLVSASSVLVHAVDRSVEHVQDVDDLGRTVAAIARDVSGLTRARWNGFEPQPFVFRGGPNSLFFAHTRRDADGAGQTSVISLRETVTGSGTHLMRGEARLKADATSFGDLRFGSQRELGTGVARIRFSYVIPPGVENAGRPLREWRTSTALPDAIMIEAVERETGRSILSMRVPIRANADIGCLASDQSRSSLPPPGGGIGAGGPPIAIAAQPGGDPAGTHGFCGRAGASQAREDAGGGAPPQGQPHTTPAGQTL